MVTKAELLSLIKKVEVERDPGADVPVRTARVTGGRRVSRKDFTGNGHWVFEEELGTNRAVGFVYVIRNRDGGRCYVGKKQFLGRGKKNKGEVTNWQWYVSSSNELSQEIRARGKESFEFIALEQYYTMGGLSYAETWSLMRAETPSRQDRWYNQLINKVSWISKEHITDRHKRRLDAVIDGSPLEGLGPVWLSG